ncbi:hypothetical protein [Mycolicibacter sinensis]|uniref:hypothetical protein n=1 Tax=Mycolicibacter sinensis (strain JDM601) TaxID=875328 RepID=UPI001041F5A8|nr:hypothetical protein [Mycolicibacter sinensis]
MTITTDGIEKWNLETLDTVFEIATERAARKADFGAALGSAGSGLKDWEGRGGDAFRRELGKHGQTLPITRVRRRRSPTPSAPLGLRSRPVKRSGPRSNRLRQAMIGRSVPMDG